MSLKTLFWFEFMLASVWIAGAMATFPFPQTHKLFQITIRVISVLYLLGLSILIGVYGYER